MWILQNNLTGLSNDWLYDRRGGPGEWYITSHNRSGQLTVRSDACCPKSTSHWVSLTSEFDIQQFYENRHKANPPESDLNMETAKAQISRADCKWNWTVRTPVDMYLQYTILLLTLRFIKCSLVVYNTGIPLLFSVYVHWFVCAMLTPFIWSLHVTNLLAVSVQPLLCYHEDWVSGEALLPGRGHLAAVRRSCVLGQYTSKFSTLGSQYTSYWSWILIWSNSCDVNNLNILDGPSVSVFNLTGYYVSVSMDQAFLY
jgi:hypothetical protein